MVRGERPRFRGSEGHREVVTTSCLEVAPRSALQPSSVPSSDFNSILLLISVTQPAFQTSVYRKLEEALSTAVPLGKWKCGSVRWVHPLLQGTPAPKLSRAAGAAQALTTAKGSLLLGALRRRGHKEGLPSGRRAINNPEAIASAALFKDGGGGTSAAEAGAAGQRL